MDLGATPTPAMLPTPLNLSINVDLPTPTSGIKTPYSAPLWSSSDANSPQSPGCSDLNSQYGSQASSSGLQEPVHWESQTTPATKFAAVAHRKPGSVAKYACHYCGKSFTRVGSSVSSISPGRNLTKGCVHNAGL
jgi:hypothetical protein